MANVNLGIQVIWTGNNVTANIAGMEAQLNALNAAVNRLSASLNNMGNSAGRSTGRAQTAFQGLMRAVNGTIRFVRNAVFAFGLLAGTVALVGRAVLDAAGKYQRFIAQLTITEGSGRAAVDQLLSISREAVNMGANIEGVIDTYARLRLVGASNARELALALGGLAATSGLGTEQIQRVTLAISQMFSKGTFVRAEEFNTQLQETLPLATRAAAEGFRLLGNTALDSVTEIQNAVQAGTLRTQDFANAIIAGSNAFINNAAAITNAKTQWDGFIQTVQIAIGAQGQMTGATAAFGIVLNAASRAMLDYIGNFERMSPEQQAQRVQQLVGKIIDLVAGFETTISVLINLGNLFVGIFRTIFNAVVLALEPIVALGMALAAIATGNWQDIPRIARAAGAAMAHTWGDINDGINQAIRGAQGFSNMQTPIADALRRQVTQMNIPELLRSAGTAPAGAGAGQGEAGSPANRAAEGRLRRLRELLENLDRLNTDLQQATERALSPLDAAVSRARGPLDELGLRFADLRTDFQSLAEQGTPVGDALDRIDAAMTRVSDQAAIAEERARALFAAQQRLADLQSDTEVAKTQENLRQLVESVTVRFEGQGTEEVRQAELRLSETRRQVANAIAQLDVQIAQASEENDVAAMARLEQQRAANQNYLDVLGQVSGATQVAAARLQALINNIRSATQNAISGLIQGLVEEGTSFDFSSWARSFISNVTQAIADNWSQKITDKIFDFLGMGRAQEVRTMNVQMMNVAGGLGGAAGGGGGGFIGALGSLFGGGGGGFNIGSIFSSIGGLFGFANGGLPGMSGLLTKFGTGGIMAGPTLFGMGGEKGKEAILPLDKIGGKLGVHAAGMGGDNFHITIQAIDTQTGAQFLQQNAQHIVGGLRQQKNLGNFR